MTVFGTTSTRAFLLGGAAIALVLSACGTNSSSTGASAGAANADSFVLNEWAIAEADKPGEIPDVAAGKSVTKTIELSAGTYVAMCNLVEHAGTGHGTSGNSGSANGHMGTGSAMDHVHFRLGMRTTFTVK